MADAVDYLYRFRPIKYLLDEPYKELIRQEIYFAEPEKLNDPVEGYCDIFWRGDETLWKNILKHYILCLDRCLEYAALGGQCRGKDFSIESFVTYDSLPTPLYKKYADTIFQLFFDRADIKSMLAFIAGQNTDIRQKELGFYLQCLHHIAIHSIMTARHQCHLVPGCPPGIDGNNSLSENFTKLANLYTTEDIAKFLPMKDLFFTAIGHITESGSSGRSVHEGEKVRRA